MTSSPSIQRDQTLTRIRQKLEELGSSRWLDNRSWWERLCWWKKPLPKEAIKAHTPDTPNIHKYLSEISTYDRSKNPRPPGIMKYAWWNPFNWKKIWHEHTLIRNYRREIQRKRRLCAYYYVSRLLAQHDYLTCPPILLPNLAEMLWAILSGLFSKSCIKQLKADEEQRRTTQPHELTILGWEKDKRDAQQKQKEKNRISERCDTRLKQAQNKWQERLTPVAQQLKDVMPSIEKEKVEMEALQAELPSLKQTVESLAIDLKDINAEFQSECDAIRAEIQQHQREFNDKVSQLEAEQNELRAGYQKSKTEIEKLKTETEKLKTEIAKLKAENAKLKAENAKLKTETEKLKTETEKLKAEIAKLKTENAKLKAKLAMLEAEHEKLKTKVKAQDKKIAQLKTEIQAVNTRATRLVEENRTLNITRVIDGLSRLGFFANRPPRSQSQRRNIKKENTIEIRFEDGPGAG